MDMIAPPQDEVDVDAVEDSTDARTKAPLARVEPFGAEEIREVMVRRKQQEQQRKVEERLRRQEYKDQLDAKVFEEELEATKQRKGGANPAVISTHDGVRTTDFKFSTNQV
jgi:hypothetical protein